MDSMQVIRAQARLIEEGRSHASVTILHADGSTPRSSGKLLALPDGSVIGSIGGGAVERMAIADALQCLRENRNATRHYDLTGADSGTGMVCGGRMSVFIESYQARPTLVMCGGGHVGLAVVRLAAALNFRTALIDRRDREQVAEAAELSDSFIQVEDYRSGLGSLELPAGACYVIATPGHAHDLEALAGALDRGGGYIGMIGSRAKTASVFEALEREGYSRERLAGVYAPIGLDIGGETPEEIALSILAEVQKVRYGRGGASLREMA